MRRSDMRTQNYYSLKEAAERIGVKYDRLWTHLTENKLTGDRLSGHWVATDERLEEWAVYFAALDAIRDRYKSRKAVAR